MNIYLPIAEMSVNVFVLFGMGAGVGFLSGMFGVGGGFLMTPLLIFYNIPPAVAVATEANQIVASSFSGALTHYRRATLDIKLGIILLIGDIAGSAIGVQFGAQTGQKLLGEQLRALLGLIVLAVCIRLGWDLVNMPTELFSIGAGGGH